jgi:hypothetical protein
MPPDPLVPALPRPLHQLRHHISGRIPYPSIPTRKLQLRRIAHLVKVPTDEVVLRPWLNAVLLHPMLTSQQ